MAITLRRDTGTALTYDQLDDNFVDYTTFRDKFDQTQWIGDNDAKLVFYNNTTGKLELKTLTNNDLDIGAFNTNFNTRLALKTTNDLAEGTNNSVGESAPGLGDGTNRLYYTTTRANADFDTRIATKTTTDLSEGSNLYYSDARVLTKINATSITQLSDVPTTLQTDDGKVISYDYNSDSFRYTTLLTSSLLPVTDHGSITDVNIITGSTGVTTTSLESLSNVNFTSVSNAVNENVLFYNGSEWVAGVVTTTGNIRDNGVTRFDALTDTPADFVGHAGKFVKVKSAEDGVEFSTLSLTTNDIGEGGSNFYYTDSRFDTRLASRTTEDLAEGSTNLYYTDARVDARIAAIGGGPSDTDALAEGSTNLYYTDARADARINTTVDKAFLDNIYAGSDNVASLNGLTGIVTIDTDNISEGTTNLYYTDSKVDTRIADRLQGNVRMRLPSYSTVQRDSLSDVVNGEMIYNTTVNKIQGHENGVWLNLSTVYG